MFFENPRVKRKRIVTGFIIGIALLFFLSFFKETTDVLRLGFAILKTFLTLSFNMPEGVELKSVSVCFYNLAVGFGFIFAIWVFLASQQALLPVRNFQEIHRTAWHLILFMLGRHGPAIFVKDGELQLSAEDQIKEGQGVVVVDLNSAVVLEERVADTGLSALGERIFHFMLGTFGVIEAPSSPRACGPGIVFTRPRERIRGAVDLRRQFRLLPQVTAYTRDGIEVTANVLCSFTVGHNPDIVQVTYIGDRRQENLRILTLNRIDDHHVQVTRISNGDELDPDDARDLYHVYRLIERNGEWLPYQNPPGIPLVPNFDPDRVFAAAFAQARTGNSEQAVDWSDLPTRVAADFYREILLQINYDDLYDVRNNERFPLPAHKRKVGQRMRNNGILSYRLNFLRTEGDFEVNKIYATTDLVISQVRPFTASKMLRDRGIKVIMGSFGDPSPVSEAIYKQRLDSWRAEWERDLDIVRADRDLEAMRIRSRAYAQAQQDLSYALTRICEDCEFSEEAMALRILQALDKAASDPKTQQLLPATTIDLLRTVNGIITPFGTVPPPPARSSTGT